MMIGESAARVDKYIDNNEKQLACHLIKPEELGEVLLVLEALSPSFLRQTTPVAYRAICKAALDDSSLTMVVGCVDTRIAGLVVCVRDYRAYWPRFFLRHPTFSWQLLVSEILRRRLPKKRAQQQRGQVRSRRDIPAIECAQRWCESSPKIAMILYIGVLPEFRRRGLARQLYKYLFEVLASEGVERVDARIDLNNHASIQMHLESGWHISTTDDGLFATIEIPR